MEREEKSFEKILEVVSGEKSLREKERAMVKAKKDAVKEMKEKRYTLERGKDRDIELFGHALQGAHRAPIGLGR